MPKRNQQRGSAFVEFALLAVLLSAGVTGAISIGWNVYIYDALVTRVTDGAALCIASGLRRNVRRCGISDRGSEFRCLRQSCRRNVVHGTPPHDKQCGRELGSDRQPRPGYRLHQWGESWHRRHGFFHFNQPSLCDDELCRVLFLNEGSSRAVATECSKGS